jgi:hypothetical protein
VSRPTRHPLADARLGLRLLRAAGRESAARLSLITVGVGVGVTLLLLVLTALPALYARQDHMAWQTTTAATDTGEHSGLWWLAVHDHYRGRDLIRVDVAAETPGAPVPPGLTRLPAPGEVAVSPALRRLLASRPPDELAVRLPGRVTATIGQAGLGSPDDLPDRRDRAGRPERHRADPRPARLHRRRPGQRRPRTGEHRRAGTRRPDGHPYRPGHAGQPPTARAEHRAAHGHRVRAPDRRVQPHGRHARVPRRTAPPVRVAPRRRHAPRRVAAISQSAGQPWQPPGAAYLLATVLGLIVAMAVTGLTLPLIAAVTRA